MPISCPADPTAGLPTMQGLRPDFASQQRLSGDNRPPERLHAHYALERELSDRLRRAPRDQRLALYTAVYRELFAALPDHPQHEFRDRASGRIDVQLYCISRYLEPRSVFLEIGCGDAALAFAVSKRVGTVYGLDVTDALIDFAGAPANFTFVPTSGIEIPLPGSAVDFAYSNQVMEHLHPDDALDQLREVYRVLKPGARYMCITPSRVTGPHDVSCYFDYEATGFHLKEYDYGALRALFGRAGFRGFSCFALVKGRQIRLPYSTLRAVELCLLTLPTRLRGGLAQGRVIRSAMGVNAVAVR